MIFTECANTDCNEPIIIGWESSQGYGFIRHECEKCKQISFIECTSVGGKTLTEADFLKLHPDAIAPNNLSNEI